MSEDKKPTDRRDFLLTLGAGDIDTLVEPIKNLLAAHIPHDEKRTA